MPRPPSDRSEPIRDEAGVRSLAADARAAGRIALDFEFLWERTYAPLPCLAQVAVGDVVHLVDPLAGAPLDPVAELVADPAVAVVMHAPSADLTLLAMAFGTQPTGVTDVQLTAGFVGLGAGLNLGALLERGLRVRLSKTESYTDWSKRPLTPEQLSYAADDVRHLMALADELDRRVQARGRGAWVAEEHARRYGPDSRFMPDPDECWRRVKGQGRLTPRDRAVLRSVAAWREHEARRRNRPSGWIIPDRTLVELARRRPTSRDALLGERGVPDRMRPAEADALLGALREGEDAPPIALGEGSTAPELQARLDVLAPLGQVVLAARAEASNLAAGLVATRDEIAAYMAAVLDAGDVDAHPLARGWRHELAGAALADLAEGRLALAPTARAPYLAEVPWPVDGAAPGPG